MTKNKTIKFEVEFEYIGDRTQVKDWFKFAVETFADNCHGDACIENARVKVILQTRKKRDSYWALCKECKRDMIVDERGLCPDCQPTIPAQGYQPNDNGPNPKSPNSGSGLSSVDSIHEKHG